MDRARVYAALGALQVAVPLLLPLATAEPAHPARPPVATTCGSMAVIGHRGEPTLAPEETLPSFAQALSDGARAIELDVQFSSDHVPVLMHDPTVDRTTNGTGPVRGYTAAAIARLDAGSWFGRGWAGVRVPTFDSALQLAAADHVRVVAELKDPATTTAELTAFLASIARTSAPVTVESFFPALLRDVARRRPRIARALITKGPVPPAQAAADGSVLIVRWDAVTAQAVRGWHAAGVQVWAWIPATPREWHGLSRAGADAVITNDTRGFLATCPRPGFSGPAAPLLHAP